MSFTLNTQQLIILILGISLIACIITNTNTEMVVAIIAGLLGYLTNNKVTSTQLTDKINTVVTEQLSEATNTPETTTQENNNSSDLNEGC